MSVCIMVRYYIQCIFISNYALDICDFRLCLHSEGRVLIKPFPFLEGNILTVLSNNMVLIMAM